MFIALIGLKEVGIIVGNKETLVALGDINTPEAVLTILGLIFICALYVRKVRGAILIGMLTLWVIGLIFGLTKFNNIFNMLLGQFPHLKLTDRGLFDVDNLRYV